MLEQYINSKMTEKDILLMCHIVLGYPSFDASYKMIETMVKAGVDLMELQIPFSEPIADGPVILHANQEALANGATVKQCFEFAKTVASDFNIPFLLMSYYNILFKHGVKEFTQTMAEYNLRGAIVPDLPPEEGTEYLEAMKQFQLAPIFIFSPRTEKARMRQLASVGGGFIYCVARKGVTGQDTNFGSQLEDYIQQCRQAATLPLAIGFGLKEKQDLDFLKAKVEIGVIGTQTIRVYNQGGVNAVEEFILSLRS